MNLQDADILMALSRKPYTSQRQLARMTGHSLGIVNRSVQQLKREGWINPSCQLTEKTQDLLAERAPHNAIILAAGFGMRMIPINFETPKAMLEVHGERLIERLIKQLQAVGIYDIQIVVGFMKEKFDYLVDKYGVKLVVNPEYGRKNNLYSLSLVKDRLKNTYIIPCDVWCEENPFHFKELYSWYMVSDELSPRARMRVNRKRELTTLSPSLRRQGKAAGNRPLGICYLLEPDADRIRQRMAELLQRGGSDDYYWERALLEGNKYTVAARLVAASENMEINTFEQLRELDAYSKQANSQIIRLIGKVFQVDEEEITHIAVMKKGMTNRSFSFEVRGKKYIFRLPGEGTGELINRENEASVYRTIEGRGLCDKPIYLDPSNGCKISAYREGARNCDPTNRYDLEMCMGLLRRFHQLKLKVGHSFPIFDWINRYEALWEGSPSIYSDYELTKEHVFSLRPFIEKERKEVCLTHIDAVPDNFIFYYEEGKLSLQLIDWEYAGMQDPHVDLAMFSIYSLYKKEQVDQLIDIYFEGKCPLPTRAKIYCYIAACGLLWSNWCEYKARFGVEFGEYSLAQYRYAKTYYRHASQLIGRLPDEG